MALLLVLLVASSAGANTVYTYHGSAMSVTSGTTPCPAPCSLSGYFEVASPIPANYSGPVTFISASFTDGTLTLNPGNSNVSISVGPSYGTYLPFQWGIAFDASNISYRQIETINNTTLQKDSTWNVISWDPLPNGTQYTAYNLASPGYWTVSSSTPEPGTLGLLGGGLLAAIGHLRRRGL